MNMMRFGNRRMIRRSVMAAVMSGMFMGGWITPYLTPPPSLASPSSVPTGGSPTNISRLLTVIGGNGRPGSTIYEAGNIGTQAAGPLEHTFILHNDARIPLILDYLQSSCPCTTASLVGMPDGATIPPGGTLSVHVSVDPNRLSPGLLHKSVWVFVQGQDAPAATLEMTGALLPAVSFSPPSLNFGRLEKGTELTQLLKVTPRANRLEQGTELRLVSSDPDVQVTEVLPPAPAAGALPETASANVHSYRVRLAPHAHVGRLQGKLSLTLAQRDDPAGTIGPVVDTVAWDAEAMGDIAASPAVVGFGVTTAGQAASRRLLLKGKSLVQEWKTLTVVSTSPYLSATLKPIPASADQVEMDVQLNPRVPAGPLDARLMVTMKSGEQLVLPVYAIVQPAMATATP